MSSSTRFDSLYVFIHQIRQSLCLHPPDSTVSMSSSTRFDSLYVFIHQIRQSLCLHPPDSTVSMSSSTRFDSLYPFIHQIRPSLCLHPPDSTVSMSSSTRFHVPNRLNTHVFGITIDSIEDESIAGIPPGKSDVSGGIGPRHISLLQHQVFRPDAARCVRFSRWNSSLSYTRVTPNPQPHHITPPTKPYPPPPPPPPPFPMPTPTPIPAPAPESRKSLPFTVDPYIGDQEEIVLIIDSFDVNVFD